MLLKSVMVIVPVRFAVVASRDPPAALTGPVTETVYGVSAAIWLSTASIAAVICQGASAIDGVPPSVSVMVKGLVIAASAARLRARVAANIASTGVPLSVRTMLPSVPASALVSQPARLAPTALAVLLTGIFEGTAPAMKGEDILVKTPAFAAIATDVRASAGTPPPSRSIAVSLPASARVSRLAMLDFTAAVKSATRSVVRFASTLLFSRTMDAAVLAEMLPVTARAKGLVIWFSIVRTAPTLSRSAAIVSVGVPPSVSVSAGVNSVTKVRAKTAWLIWAALSATSAAGSVKRIRASRPPRARLSIAARLAVKLAKLSCTV